MLKIYFKPVLLLLSLFGAQTTLAQGADKLFNELDSITPKETQYTYASFKSTRVINGHSIERMKEGQLDVRISHRFGLINLGAYELFGLDQATNLLSLEYGIKDWVMVGLNRASNEKTYSGFTKFSILRQSSGAKIMPVSMSYLFQASIVGTHWADPNRDNLFSSRVSYTNQLIVARKFNERISLQLSPTWMHRNLVKTVSDKNDLFAVGVSGRYKITRRIAFNGEYFPVIQQTWHYKDPSYTNNLSFGFDIETGGHVFQLLVSNSLGMTEKSFIGETTGKWSKGNLHFGFNISRVFALKGKKH